VNRQCWRVGRPWVDAGIQELQGVVKVFVPPDSACYECGMTAKDYQLLNLRYSCPLLPRQGLQRGKVPTAPTIASMMAALEVQEALKILHGLPVAAGAAHVYNGVGNRFYTTRLPFRHDCLSHETYPQATPIGLSADDRCSRLFEHARAWLAGPLRLQLDRELATERRCPRCLSREAVLRPRRRLTAAELICAECGQEAILDSTSEIADDSPLAQHTLQQLGIPPFDIVRIDGSSGSGFYLLEADRDRVQSGVRPVGLAARQAEATP
jgi:predicted RNA-binding Zn-ribbon protein involved in translation (DUF1610 family)